MRRDISFPPSISNGLQHHMASIENENFFIQLITTWCWVSPGVNFHRRDETGGGTANSPA